MIIARTVGALVLVNSSLLVRFSWEVASVKLSEPRLRISGVAADADDVTFTVTPVPMLRDAKLRVVVTLLAFPPKLTAPLAMTLAEAGMDPSMCIVAPLDT